MHLHLISGFLGSGKTTAILKAAKYLLAEGKKVAVITNDQGAKLVDAALFSREGIPGEQVLEGCFCCRYDDLEIAIGKLHQTVKPDIILAEAVGSCTDMIATVIKPLLSKTNQLVETVSFSSFADWRLLEVMLQGNGTGFADEIRYIFFKQLEEAGNIVINKTDLGDVSRLKNLEQVIASRYPAKPVFYQNSNDIATMNEWLLALTKPLLGALALETLDVDYDIYATGEAKLAYLDQQLQITSDTAGVLEIGIALIDKLAERFRQLGWNIGHLKTWSEEQGKYSYSFGGHDNIDPATLPRLNQQLLLVNARIEASPEALAKVFWDTVAETEKFFDCGIKNVYSRLYTPGYPVPRHRIA